MPHTTVLSSSYFPPIAWFAVAAHCERVTIDVHEHYVKQTWRNRCRIGGANGPLDLILPVRTVGNHTPMKDVRIDYHSNWQRVHWHAIRSAYGKSPFFEYYADRFAPLFSSQPEFLIDWNEKSCSILTSALKISPDYTISQEYCEYVSPEQDYRKLLHPRAKQPVNIPIQGEYIQVFQEKFGFQHGLSALDLLFCTGPEAKSYLIPI